MRLFPIALISAGLAIPALVAPALASAAVELGKLQATDPFIDALFADTCDLHTGLAILGASGVPFLDAPGGAYLFDVATRTQLAKFDLPSDLPNKQEVVGVALGDSRAYVGTITDTLPGYRSLVHLFDTTDPVNPSLITTIIPSDADFDDDFGRAMVTDGPTTLIAAPSADDNGALSGAVYIFDTATGAELGKFTPDDGEGLDQFGFSVDLDGNLAIVGARWESERGTRAGAAYLFDISDPAHPVQLAKLLGSEIEADDMFGFSVAIDGDLAIVGAIFDDDLGLDSGAAYVFDVSDPANPVETVKITTLDGNGSDDIGWDVSLDGATALITARTDDDLFPGGGSAYLYDLTDPTTPVEMCKITPSDGHANQVFGWSADLDGDRVLVGASQDDELAESAGAAYLYDISGGPTPCNDADLSEPLGVLDFSDVLAFLTAFGSMQPAADIAPPAGVFDFSDVLAFLTAFGGGCP
ncbi:MAG: FG-GAP repeat protein [Phycisphaerales bacterium]